VPDLASDRLRALLTQVADQYDWVMVVAPPILSSASARALASLTEGVVLVVGASTAFPSVERAIAELGRGSIVGTVLHGLEGLSDTPSGWNEE
jgi:Mrp family chromosome partitioning ATPase